MKMKVNYVPKRKRFKKKQLQEQTPSDPGNDIMRSILYTTGVPQKGWERMRQKTHMHKTMPKTSKKLMK